MHDALLSPAPRPRQGLARPGDAWTLRHSTSQHLFPVCLLLGQERREQACDRANSREEKFPLLQRPNSQKPEGGGGASAFSAPAPIIPPPPQFFQISGILMQKVCG